MKYGEPQAITIQIIVTRQPAMFHARATSELTGDMEGVGEGQNETDSDMSLAAGRAVQDLLNQAGTKYQKLVDASSLVDLKPKAKTLFENLTVLFARK